MKTAGRNQTLRGVLAGVATAALMSAGVATASAHVHVTPDTTDAGASTQLTFESAHGCEGSPTTKMTFTLPEEINDATPTAKANWEVKKVTEELDEPKTLENGTTITERVSQIVYTADEPLPDGVRETFTIGVDLPDSAGETLAFPTLQTCQEGQTDWAQIPEEGQDDHSLEAPAPTLEITKASASDGHGHGAEEGQGTESGEQGEGEAADGTEQAASVSDNDSSMIGWVGLITGLLGLAAGITAMVMARRKA